MAIRVIQWATGGVGRAAVAGIVAHPELELVGCWVHSPEKAGRDVGELCGLEPLGVVATADVDRLVGLDAECVVYSPIMADPAVVARLLASGKNVVTPLNWFFPGGRDEGRIEAACREGGSSVHGTGIHPGGITERFPLTVSALSQSITHVRAEEFSDIRSYGAPGVVGDIMLFGKTPEEADSSMMPAILGDGFGQSVAMVAHALGFALDAGAGRAPRGGGGHRADRLTHRAHPAGTHRRPEVLLGGQRPRHPRHHRPDQLVHGPGPPGPGLDLRSRGRAVRGGGDRRPVRPG